jgi:hypothetical protein
MINPDLFPYLQVYGVVGSVTCIAFVLNAWIQDRKPNPLADALNLKSRPALTIVRLIKGTAAKLLGTIILVLAWPLVWVSGAMILRDHVLSKIQDERTRFVVKRKHLKSHCQAATVEKNNLIKDPLAAVPALPFGHLNAVWTQFLIKQPTGAELWSFECHYQGPWGHPELRSGYVWLLNKTVTHWVTLDLQRLDAKVDRHLSDL